MPAIAPDSPAPAAVSAALDIDSPIAARAASMKPARPINLLSLAPRPSKIVYCVAFSNRITGPFSTCLTRTE
jgi:hypothetical protein